MSARTVPEPYLALDDEVLDSRIRAAKEALGSRAVILGHHYQRDDVIAHADVTGDSFKLARLGAVRTDAAYIVFCGVHFMAESADILRGPGQTVILPDLAAGCSMADMAATEDVLLAGDTLDRLGIRSVPVTYMNSTAELKAFCGERGGAVCTSSNAKAVFEWAQGLAEFARIDPEHVRDAAGRRQQVHQHLDRSRLARAVGPEQSKHAARRHGEIEPLHRLRAPKPPREIYGFDDVHGK